MPQVNDISWLILSSTFFLMLFFLLLLMNYFFLDSRSSNFMALNPTNYSFMI